MALVLLHHLTNQRMLFVHLINWECGAKILHVVTFLFYPYVFRSALAWAITGDLLVADQGGNRIRLVTVPGAVVCSRSFYN